MGAGAAGGWAGTELGVKYFGPEVGRYVGLISGMAAGTATYGGLNMADGQLNFTGAYPKEVSTRGIGWKVGDPIDNLTSKGDEPAWSTVQQRFWKNEAFNDPENYSLENVARMQKGLAPQRFNLVTGEVESKELHHIIPQRSNLPGIHNESNLIPVWPDEHAAIDPFRHTGAK